MLTSSPSSKIHSPHLLALFALALLGPGCLFSDVDPSASNSNNNNTTTTPVVIVNNNTSPPDMAIEEDMGDEEDLGAPVDMEVEPDLGPVPDCAVDGDCDPGETCDVGICVPAPGCTSDDACGPMGACIEEECISLLESDDNCGFKGFECPDNTFCQGGMCVCDGVVPMNNSRVIATSTNERLVHYPKPQMVGYFSIDRFLCDGAPFESSEDFDCAEEDIEHNPDYPADGPHYMLGFVSDKTDIELRLIDERGATVQGSTNLYRGNTSRGEKEVRNFRILQTFGPETLMLVWWHDAQAPEGKRDVVHLYQIKVTDNRIIETTPFLNENGTPQRAIETSGLSDFGYALASYTSPDGITMEALAMPYVFDDPMADGTDLYLKLNTILTIKKPGETERSVIAQEEDAINIGPARQVLTGFDVQATFTGEGLFVSTTTLEDTDENAGLNNYLTAYMHRVFRVRIDDLANSNVIRGTLIEPDPWRLFDHRVTNAAAVFLEVAFGSDISNIPPAPFIFPGGGPAEWIAIGWSRARDNAGNVRRAILNIVGTGPSGSVEAAPRPTIQENRYVYDQNLVSNLLDFEEPLMVWLEADQLPNQDPKKDTTIKFAPLILNDANFPMLGQETAVNGMKIDAQRATAQFGTRSVGVFTFGKDEIRFFAIVDEEPVCAIPGPPR